MALILTVDGLGKRYGMLPSEAMERGTTFDLFIMDAAMSFENYHHKKAMNNGEGSVPDLSEDEMKAILDKVKGK